MGGGGGQSRLHHFWDIDIARVLPLRVEDVFVVLARITEVKQMRLTTLICTSLWFGCSPSSSSLGDASVLNLTAFFMITIILKRNQRCFRELHVWQDALLPADTLMTFDNATYIEEKNWLKCGGKFDFLNVRIWVWEVYRTTVGSALRGSVWASAL